MRKFLVVIQFSIAVVFIVGTLVLNRQLRFVKANDMGFDKDRILTFVARDAFRSQYETVRSEVLQHPGIEDATASNLHTVYNPSYQITQWDGSQAEDCVVMYLYDVDDNYADMFGLEVVEGRFFSEEFSTDESEAVVINEAAAKAMRMDSPLGKRVVWEDRTYRIIGVVKDFHFQSLHHRIEPMILYCANVFRSHFFVKLRSDAYSFEAINQLYNECMPSPYPGVPVSRRRGKRGRHGLRLMSRQPVWTDERRYQHISSLPGQRHGDISGCRRFDHTYRDRFQQALSDVSRGSRHLQA